MTDGIVVRPARWEEADRVAALCNAINSLDGNRPIVPMTGADVRRDLLDREPWAELFVAADGDALVGFVTGSRLHDSARSAGAYMVVDLYVVPEARRRGVARALLHAVTAETARRGGSMVWWTSKPGNDGAVAFYRAMGGVSEPVTAWSLRGSAFDGLTTEARP